MSKAVLHSGPKLTPLLKADAQRLRLPIQPLAPAYTEHNIGLVLDRSDWVELPLNRWMVAYRVVDQRGQPVIAELRIFPLESHKRPPGQWSGMYGASTRVPPGGITARFLRQIKTQAFRVKLREIVAKWAEQLTAIDHPLARPARGRKGRSDLELARIAAAYERAYLAHSESAIKAVAKEFKLSPSQARDAVHRARIRGLLSPASKQGQGGGTLTLFGQTVLKQSKKGRPHHAKH